MRVTNTNGWTPSRILKLRQHTELSQPRFALMVGCDANTLSRWERGNRKPGPVFQKKLTSLAVAWGME